MRSVIKIASLSLLAIALAALPMQVLAQSTNKPPVEKKEPSAKRSRSIPFEGNLKTVDKAAKTITVDKRTFAITSETKIFRGDKPATLDSGVVGEFTTGSYRKGEDGKLTARSVYFGGKTSGKSADKKTEK